MNGNYEKVIDWCKKILEDVIRNCDLEEDFTNRLYELTLDWQRLKENAEREGREIGGLKVIFMGLDACMHIKTKQYTLTVERNCCALGVLIAEENAVDRIIV